MTTDQRGFTLIEILVSLAIFAVVVIGALGVLGAAGSGGFLSGVTTSFATTRAARDITAATVYLQAFQEYAANRAVSVGDTSLIPGSYCQWRTGPACSNPALSSSGLGSGWPTTPPGPPDQPFQLDWQKMDVTIQRWCWDDTTKKYVHTAGCDMVPGTEYLVRVHSTLTWQYRGVTRTLDVDRYLP